MGRRGVALEPHSADALAALGWAYFGDRRYADAIPIFQKAVAMTPDAAFPLWSLGYSQQVVGEPEAAVLTLRRAVEVTRREHCFEIALLGGALAASGHPDEARVLLSELQDRGKRDYVPPFDLAWLYAALGDREEALTELERAYQHRNGLLWARIHFPEFDPLLGEPRWKALADKLAKTAPIKPFAGR